MNSFEEVVGAILSAKGFWVQHSLKVDLTKEEKRQIGRPSSPRWELDIVAYKGATNEIFAVECKSYLDSPGVRFQDLSGSNQKKAGRYKLFNDSVLRNVVFSRLASQLSEAGSCPTKPTIRLCLAAGRIASDADREQLGKYFTEKGWLLWDNAWIKGELNHMAQSGYEDQATAIVAKLLLK